MRTDAPLADVEAIDTTTVVTGSATSPRAMRA